MKNKYEVIITEDCNDEIDRICDYMFNKLHAYKACNKLLEEVIEVIDILENLPFIYPRVTRYKPLKKEFRKVTVNNYVIIYDIEESENKVYLDHMLYGRSDYINKI